jgi:hypothetical protein
MRWQSAATSSGGLVAALRSVSCHRLWSASHFRRTRGRKTPRERVAVLQALMYEVSATDYEQAVNPAAFRVLDDGHCARSRR